MLTMYPKSSLFEAVLTWHDGIQLEMLSKSGPSRTIKLLSVLKWEMGLNNLQLSCYGTHDVLTICRPVRQNKCTVGGNLKYGTIQACTQTWYYAYVVRRAIIFGAKLPHDISVDAPRSRRHAYVYGKLLGAVNDGLLTLSPLSW